MSLSPEEKQMIGRSASVIQKAALELYEHTARNPLKVIEVILYAEGEVRKAAAVAEDLLKLGDNEEAQKIGRQGMGVQLLLHCMKWIATHRQEFRKTKKYDDLKPYLDRFNI